MATVPDFKNKHGLWAKSGRIGFGPTCKTKSHEVWLKMKQRCVSEIYQAKHPSYVGCFMSEEFQNYQLFAEWCQTQIGYGLPQYDLDKDFLVPGNKEYGAEQCAFIPHALNALFCTHQSSRRTDLPIGVSQRRDGNRYCAAIALNGSYKILGYYASIAEASAVYQEAKLLEIKKWLSKIYNQEFVVDLQITIALQNLVATS